MRSTSLMLTKVQHNNCHGIKELQVEKTFGTVQSKEKERSIQITT